MRVLFYPKKMKRTNFNALLIVCYFLFAKGLQSQTTPVYTVLFTHIEDNSPNGTLGTDVCRQNYLFIRSRLLDLGSTMNSYHIKWSLEPDWKFLLAALLYEDAVTIQSTNGKNILKYLKEDLNVAIDPHSHEKSGYNYTDVAHLLDSLGVGGSNVIGGHIWDPSLPQFAEWDRFRNPVYGTKYPWAVWQGNILMGSGTPNHVNDPLVSGVWRPKDRDHYFTDDPNGNIYCVGKYKEDLSSINELIDLYRNKSVDASCMLTTSYHINPSSILAQNGIATIETTILKPMDSLRALNEIVLTDFTNLISDWKSKYQSNACIYDPSIPTSSNEYSSTGKNEYELLPNPVTSYIHINHSKGNEFYEIMNSSMKMIWSGKQIEHVNLSYYPDGLYLLRITENNKSKPIKFIKI